MDTALTQERRSAVENPPSIHNAPGRRAFHKLPDEIIEHILLETDPNGFASLILLNAKWRATSQRPHLYAHHLSQCPSYAASHPPIPPADDEHLPLLRRLFAREVKRNLFEAYLRPKRTLVKLVSNSISSSSCPGGEGMQFSFSPRGKHVLAYNSSRIHVLAVYGPSVQVKREFKIQRRPLSACVTDDATILAVLSNELQVDVYDLRASPPRRKQSLILDNSPRTIAISACGTVLAAAYDGGIEVSALDASALPTQKRAVKCDAVDALAFSPDGTQLLGTTVHSSPPSTVVLTAPYYDPGNQMLAEDLSAMWTTSILFPNTSRDCSHATWLHDGERGEPEWTFTYDRCFETFRAVRLDDLRNGTTYFTGPIPRAASQTKLVPCTLPAATTTTTTTTRGGLVSAGFQGRDIWIYGVPEDLDAVPEASSASRSAASSNISGLARHGSTRSCLSRHASSSKAHDIDEEQVPHWQVLCDKARNNLVAGVRVIELGGVSGVKWVQQSEDSASSHEQLVVTATGVVSPGLASDKEDMDFVDGGRIAVLDFDYGILDGETVEVTIEVGADNVEPLEEERRDLETDVAIVRRRTVAQKRRGSAVTVQAATMAGEHGPLAPALPANDDGDDDPLVPRMIGQHPVYRSGAPPPESEPEDSAAIEEQEALDAPYAHSSPRSNTTLRRAATAAAVNRRLNPRTADGRLIEYRRADGRAEHPHESDADNWVPPPPPYQKDDPGDLPAFLRGPSVAPVPNTIFSPIPPIAPPAGETPSFSLTWALHQPDQAKGNGMQCRRAHQRTASDSTTVSRQRMMTDMPRPRSTPSVHSMQVDDIYDITPQGSPRMPICQPTGSTWCTETGAVPQSGCGEPPSSAVLSGAGLAAAPLNPGSSAGGVPALHLPMPDASCLALALEPAAAEGGANAGLLSHAPTWPRQLAEASDSTTPPRHGLLYTATLPNVTLNDAAAAAAAAAAASSSSSSAALPPAPSSSQVASLNKRISQGNPRRLSGNILNPSLWTDQGRSVTEPERIRTPRDGGSTAPMRRRGPLDASLILSTSEHDRPLIISTPTGVSGSRDPPMGEKLATGAETAILAPTPRRPRPNRLLGPGGAAEQLEYMCGNQPAPAPLPPHMRASANALPMWMRTPSNSSRRTASSAHRRRSRAERSAIKNIKDAKLRGWTRKRAKNKEPGADGGGWVDVRAPAQQRTGKCVMM
ncbi:uncharacterized protein UV8b_01996 [Ustilaginoidea virens]|uniref:DUF7165 domain-containing protein n=1 Tax=Ustilaginoidea virens TaxID=1159556 RepID=A0A8E5HLM5_USTVR|nr:uncharacterized protein UV8b_01996 [Ustilaginoidea virens]QUC17755.1 hypothetical protein UV8b_01996 [Ustilaginoidea virens]